MGTAAEWECRDCTKRLNFGHPILNNPEWLSCGICKKERAHDTNGRWICTKCSFANEPSTTDCSMCETKRPTAAPINYDQPPTPPTAPKAGGIGSFFRGVNQSFNPLSKANIAARAAKA